MLRVQQVLVAGPGAGGRYQPGKVNIRIGALEARFPAIFPGGEVVGRAAASPARGVHADQLKGPRNRRLPGKLPGGTNPSVIRASRVRGREMRRYARASAVRQSLSWYAQNRPSGARSFGNRQGEGFTDRLQTCTDVHCSPCRHGFRHAFGTDALG
jgi:hypothetical protein